MAVAEEVDLSRKARRPLLEVESARKPRQHADEQERACRHARPTACCATKGCTGAEASLLEDRVREAAVAAATASRPALDEVSGC